jgi:hypothetical protein
MILDTITLMCAFDFLVWKLADDLSSFHLLAIPLLNEQHTGESLFHMFSKVLNFLFQIWRDRTIGSNTDGAPYMTGCNVEFRTLLTNTISSSVFYRVWCLGHHLDIVIKAAANVSYDVGGFPFMNIMTTANLLARR